MVTTNKSYILELACERPRARHFNAERPKLCQLKTIFPTFPKLLTINSFGDFFVFWGLKAEQNLFRKVPLSPLYEGWLPELKKPQLETGNSG